MIGLFHETNVVRLRSSVSLGERCVTAQKTAAKETNFFALFGSLFEQRISSAPKSR